MEDWGIGTSRAHEFGVSHQADELAERMHRFSIRVVGLCGKLPATPEGFAVRRQLVKAGTGVTANYRAARRARSHAEFTARMGVTSEEADEAVFWLRLTIDSSLLTGSEVQELRTEAQEISAICSAAYRTARSKDRQHRR